MDPRALKHYKFINTCLSYNTNDSPLAGPHWESGSQNILTTIKQYAEKAPGWIPLESNPTTFTGNVVRAFTWETWSGDFYIFVVETYAGHSNLCKLKVGTDAAFVSLYDDVTTTAPWDLVISNNTVYMMNGSQAWAWKGGAVASIRPWGIGTAVMVDVSYGAEIVKGRPAVSLGGTGLAATVGYRYVYTYYNSTSGHQSSASNPSATTGAFTDNTVTITMKQTSDAQVDKVRVYRTTDGGGGIYFEISGSPFAHTPGTATMAVTDVTLDADLSSARAPVGADLSNETNPMPMGMNDVPTPGYGPVWFANRIWYFKDNALYYSGWEEIVDIGIEEECFPPSNLMIFSSAITGLATNDQFLLVFSSDRIWKISGDTLATFQREPLFYNLGVRNRACIARYGRAIAWFDTSHTVRITDGFQEKELSIDIRPSIASVDPATASLSFYSNGTYHWLCLLDGGTGGKMWVYDLDLEQWMPEWAYVGAGKALHWGQIAAGTPALLMSSATNRVLKVDPTTWLFDGTAYTATLVASLLELVPPDQPSMIACPQLITLERNAVPLNDVLELRDENTDTGAFDTDFGNICTVGAISPPLRPIATDLVEEWFGTQMIACRRFAPKFTWAGGSTNHILYSFSVGFYET